MQPTTPPVSYTHLDVYKRQHLARERERKGDGRHEHTGHIPTGVRSEVRQRTGREMCIRDRSCDWQLSDKSPGLKRFTMLSTPKTRVVIGS